MLKKILLISFFVFSCALNAKILMQPYLQAVSQNDIYVMVESDNKQPVTITYWENEKNPKAHCFLLKLKTPDNSHIFTE